MNQFETLIALCDAAIRDGKAGEAAARLSQLNAARIPREWRLPLAKLCRRSGQYSTGLRLLTRLVNSSESRHHGDAATPGELTEYAALLLRSGAALEALRKLERVDADAAPEAHLIRAFVHFARWNFAAAIPSLEAYLSGPLSPDAILVGRSNLAFAHSECGHYEEAARLADRNIRLAKDCRHIHLENYNHALLGQIHLEERNFVLARQAIESALQNLGGGGNSTHFFAMKLKLIVDGLQNETLEPFAELRRLAGIHRQWNALREADLYSLKVRFEAPRFHHLYFGSPLPGLRERIWRELERRPEQESFILGSKSAPCFDLISGEIDGRPGLRATFKCHQLMEVLLRDFYQPNPIAGLHAALFPEEYFNISTSPERVHQILRRTRRWLEAKKIPVAIVSDREFYSLKILGEFSFRVPLEHGPADLHSFHLDRLRAAASDSPNFSAERIGHELGISLTSVHRFLRKAIERGEIQRLGPSNRPSGYKFTSQAGTKAS